MRTAKAMGVLGILTGGIALAGCGGDDGDGNGGAGSGTYLYVWAGPRRAGDGLEDPPGNDVLVTLDRADGKALHVLGVGSKNNEPHHMAACGDHLYAGGLFSGKIFVISIANPAAPRLVRTIDGGEHGLGAADDFRCLDDGRVLATMMSSAEGRSPGGILEIAADQTVAGTHPAAPPEGFNPHGLDVDADGGRMVTTDLMELGSVAVTPPVPVVRSTIRVWDLATMEITHTVEVCTGPMEADFFENDPQGRILVSCMVDGAFGVVTRGDDGNYTYEMSLDVDGPELLQAALAGIRLSEDNRTFWVALPNLGEVRRYDVSNTAAPALQATATVGPGAHFMRFSADGATAYVSDYVVQRLEVLGMLPADNLVWRVNAQTMAAEVLANFQTGGGDVLLEAQTLPLQPHGLALK